MTKGKSVRTSHLVIAIRVSIIVLIINVILAESLGWRRRKRYDATHLSLSSSNMANTSVHLTQLIAKSVKESIYVLKLSHGGLKSHTTTRRRGSRGGWNEGGWRSRRLSLWLLQLKLGLTSSNRWRAQGTHKGEVNRLEIGDRGAANDPCYSIRKDKLIMSHHIHIDIYKGENEVGRKVYSKVLNEGKQKASIRLGNGVILRQGMEKKCHYHNKEPRTLCKAQAWGVLSITLWRRCLIKERQKFVFGHSPQTWTT